MTTVHTQRPTLLYVACFYPDITAFAGLLLSRHSHWSSKLRWLASMGIETVLGLVVGVDGIRPLEVEAQEVIPATAELRPNGVRVMNVV